MSALAESPSVGGTEAIARVRTAFEENFSLGRECGAALSIWRGGREVLNIHRGYRDAGQSLPWQDDTLVLVWSATKGPASACVLRALDAAGQTPDLRVAEIWPEFAASGKANITVADVLCHRAGLCAVANRSVNALDHEAVAAALAVQAPLWKPRSAHGYGPRAFGYLVDEIVHRLVGIPLGAFWRQAFAGPLELDFWIGLPEALHSRVADIVPPRAAALSGERTEFERSFAQPGSLTHAAFSSPAGLSGMSTMNSPAARSACLPALGGIGSAQALAKFYWALATGEAGIDSSQLSSRLVNGDDLVLKLETAFSHGFMLDPIDENGKVRHTFGPSPEAFGHPGAGGSLAFADPANGISFAYVMNQMEPGALPRDRTRRLVRALYA